VAAPSRAAATAQRALILTADDFGQHVDINAGIARAAQAGVLSATSLMVGAPALDDALARARDVPGLRIGLHLTLIDGRATLPARAIPHLVDAHGHFRTDMVRYGFRLFADKRMRREIRAEIRAQFETYASLGLKLDHVDTHKHFHLHPTLLDLILEVGAEFDLRAMRLPREPVAFAFRAAASAGVGAAALTPLLLRMRRRFAAAGVRHNDQMYGMAWSGAMLEARLLAVLDALPAGVSEIYFHPATSSGETLAQGMRGYRNREELEALLSAAVRARLAALELEPCGYSDLVA
jgi:hopanoid biosynthesis associated protein HpnK